MRHCAGPPPSQSDALLAQDAEELAGRQAGHRALLFQMRVVRPYRVARDSKGRREVRRVPLVNPPEEPHRLRDFSRHEIRGDDDEVTLQSVEEHFGVSRSKARSPGQGAAVPLELLEDVFRNEKLEAAEGDNPPDCRVPTKRRDQDVCVRYEAADP